MKILIVLLLGCWTCSTYKVSDFKPSILKPSPPSGYHNVDTGPNTEGEILCFGDLNGDQQQNGCYLSNDYIATRGNPEEIIVYFWNEAASQFTSDTLSLKAYSGKISKIQQVMLNDLSGDGTQQVIITYIPTQDSKYSTIAYRAFDCKTISCSYEQYQMPNSNLVNMSSPPSLINIQGVSIGFLVFQNQGKNRFIVEKSEDGNYKKNKFSQYLNDNKKPQLFKKVDKHFASNIDFDGDCHSDLVLLSTNGAGNYVLQFYQKQTNSYFTFATEMVFNSTIKFFTFIDFDSSGTVDILLVTGQTGKQQIEILYNIVSQPDQICEKFQRFAYDITTIKKLPLPSPISTGSILHFGDINSDSYPDLLTIVKTNDFRKPGLFKNVLDQNGERKFEQAQDLNANLIFQAKNPRQVAFFDLGQDGKIDIFVMVQQSRDSDNAVVVTRSCFLNNVKDDTLFIKILPLSQTATYHSGSTKLSNAFGITIQWRITKLDGYKKISLLNQKSQWNYGTLQLPFASGGLGRTNNYVQDLTVGYEATGQKMSWSPVIPDSKLLVYQQEGKWKLETLLTNSERVNQVIYVSVIILFVLGLVIFFLNYRENQEDKKDQYNFIQLIR